MSFAQSVSFRFTAWIRARIDAMSQHRRWFGR
jgi:hypothetical protein